MCFNGSGTLARLTGTMEHSSTGVKAIHNHKEFFHELSDFTYYIRMCKV